MNVFTGIVLFAVTTMSPGAPTGAPDTALRRLIDILAFSTDGEEGIAYAKACEKALAQSPDSPLKQDACQRIGDIYYVQQRYPEMAKWYRKILEIDPSLEQSTPIGFRLSEYGRFSLRRNILVTVYCVYGFIISFLLLRIVRNRRLFDWRFFLKHAGIWGATVIIAEIAVLVVDAVFSSGTALGLTNQEASDMNMGLPAVPLGFLDSSNAALAGMVLVLGLVPVLLVVLYVSFIKNSSRIVAGLIALLSAGALCIHFIITASYDEILTPVAHIVNKRIWFNGELEKLLVKDPQKVLRANPAILKSGNEDLKLFLEANFPKGLTVEK